MNCPIDAEKYKSLVKYTTRVLNNSMKSGLPFNIEAVSKELYNSGINKTNDPNRAIAFVMALPQAIREVQNLDAKIREYIAPNYAEIVKLESEFQDIKKAFKYIEVGAKTYREDIEAEERLKLDIADGTLDRALAQPVPVLRDIEKAVPLFAFTDAGQEAQGTTQEEVEKNIPDPEKAVYYKVKRKIINLVNSLPSTQDSSQINLPGVKAGGIYLTAMASNKILDNQLYPHTQRRMTDESFKNVHQTQGIVLAITDIDGNLVHFDENADVTSPAIGKPMYYFMRAVRKEGDNYTLSSQDKNLINMGKVAAELSRRTGTDITITEAEQHIQDQLANLNDIREYINKDRSNNTIRSTITGGTLGYIKESRETKTNLSEVKFNFTDNPFHPIVEKGKNVKTWNSGTYFTLKGIETVIPLQRKRFSKELAEKIANLSTSEIYKSIDGLNELMPDSDKFEYLSKLIQNDPLKFSITLDNEGKLIITINQKRLDLKDPASKDQIFQYLQAMHTTDVPKSNLAGKKVIDGRGRDYRQELYEGAIVQTDNNIYKQYLSPTVYIHGPSLLAPESFKDFDISLSGTKNILTDKPVPYYRVLESGHVTGWLADNTYINFKPNDNGELIALNSHFEFQPVSSDMEKVYPIPEGNKGDETKAKDLQKKEEGTPDKDLESKLGDIASEFNKLNGQKRLDIKATEEQIQEAKQWYSKHPLSKYFPVNIMFNAINTATPNGVASWTTNAITLYAGADYSDLYHESWHGFTQTFLTKEEKQSLYKEQRRRSGSFKNYMGTQVNFSAASDLDLEEHLAEDFRNYMLKNVITKEFPTRNTIFRKIWNFLKALFGKTNISQVSINEQAIATINELYNKLRVGDLSEYTFNEANANFHVLNKGIEALSKEDSLNYDDSSLLVDTLDSVFSHYIDFKNSGVNNNYGEFLKLLRLEEKERSKEPMVPPSDEYVGDVETLRRLRNMGAGQARYTSTVITTPNGRTSAYKFAQAILTNQRDQFIKQLAKEENSVIKDQLQRKIDLLKFALDNFGDVNKPMGSSDEKGLISYHNKMSKYMAFEDKYFIEDENLEDSMSRDSLGSLEGNAKSLLDLASDETAYLIRSLHAIDKQGNSSKNRLGINKLADFVSTWNRLAKVLEGSNSPQEMQRRLVNENKSGSFPIVPQLLRKLGSPDSVSGPEFAMWTRFFNDFNLTRVPLVQLTINAVDTGGQVKYYAQPGYASADFKKVGYAWNNTFRQTRATDYIKTDDKNVNYLDITRVLHDYPNSSKDSFGFYRSIGVLLDDNEEIRKEVNELGSIYIKNKLKALLDRGWVVKSLDEIFKENPAVTKEGTSFPALRHENTTWNALQSIQSRYSDQYSNFAVTNAAGNVQFEHTLNSTLTKQVNAINQSKTYAELISLPHMSHLDIKRNPFVGATIWLNSIFDFNNGGIKRKVSTDANAPDITISLENLSGVQLTTDGERNVDGITSSESDEFSKFLTEFHMMVLRGSQENVKHADKSTALTSKLTRIISEGTTKGKHYIDFDRIIVDPNNANRNLVNILIPYISAELQRIRYMRDAGPDSPALNVKDYYERGKKFVMFDDVLSQETKQMLYDLDTTLVNHIKEANQDSFKVKDAISRDVIQYFAEKTQENNNIMSQAKFFSDDLIGQVKQTVDSKYKSSFDKLSIPEILAGIMRGYTINSWIHNAETVMLFYGDPATYSIEKEDFHKRNAGIGATGTFHRTDPAAMQFANEVLGRPYASKMKLPVKAFNTTLPTAVMDDTISTSTYIDSYTKAIEKDELRKLHNSKEYREATPTEKTKLEEKTRNKASSIAEPYKKMTEADAQGMITFDAYRILMKLRDEWTSQQEQLFQDIVEGKEVSPQDTTKFFPVQKYQYWGQLDTGDQKFPVSAFHKFSVMPLIPNMIKGTVMEQLHHKMIREGIEYGLFKSGSKMSTITDKGKPDVFYGPGRVADFSEGTKKFTPNPIYLEYLKNQLYTSPEFKGKVTFSTQLRKLIEEGLMEGGVPTDYMTSESLDSKRSNWNSLNEDQRRKTSPKYNLLRTYEDNVAKLTELKKEELLEEAGWKIGPNGKPAGNPKTLIEFMRKELDRQDLGEHEKDFIDYDSDNNSLKHDLSISLSADKLERLLTAVVNKRLIRQKVNGEALIQVSGVGFEKAGFTNPTEEDIQKYKGTNDLPTYHQKADGSTAAMKVKVAIQGNFEKLLLHPDIKTLSKQEKISKTDALNKLIKDDKWLDKEDNRRMITMVGVRIPVQGLNSMEFMEVYEFLPKAAGNIIIPPAEIVAKAGSDFDVDKLTIIMPNLAFNNNKVKLYKPSTSIVNKTSVLENLDKLNTKKNEIVYKHQDNLDKIMKEGPTSKFAPEEISLLSNLRKEYKKELGKANTSLNEAQTAYTMIVTGKTKVSYDQSKKFEQDLINAIDNKNKIIVQNRENLKQYTTAMKTNVFDQENERYQEELEPVNSDIEEGKDMLNATKAKAYENELISNIRSILELPDNFSSLIRPNGTDIVKPLADRLRDIVKKYDSKKRVFPTDDKSAKQLSGTRIFETGYNLSKHSQNNIGKQTLGIGAVDNTYNVVFNRIGAYLNRDYIQKVGRREFPRQQKILLDHNTMKVDNKEVISLSHVYDANGENKISDVINQLINGWVDVAKDAWIFDLNANKEVSPVLLFMIQAGVPFKQAGYIASQPMVKEYIQEMKLAKSTFAAPLNKAPQNPMWFRNKARETMLLRYNLLHEGELGWNLNTNLYNLTQNYTTDAGSEAFTEKQLLDNIKKGSVDPEEADTKSIAAFLHFIALEDMAKVLTEVKTRTNFDTKKSSSLFEAQNRNIMLNVLMSNQRIDSKLIDKILDESPIGSFHIQDFMIGLWKPFFNLRDNNVVNEFLTKKLKEGSFKDDMDNTFGDAEVFVNEFKNDLVSYIFQNTVRAFDLNTIKNYKGFDIESELPVEEVSLLRFGVFAKDGKIYVDKNRLKNDFATFNISRSTAELTSMYDSKRQIAVPDPGTFKKAKEYYNFVFEREYLRSILTPEDVKADPNYIATLKSIMSNDKIAGTNQDLKKIAYEVYLRDKALDNTFNDWKMFRAPNSYSDQFMEIKRNYPQLKDNYYIFSVIAQSTSKRGGMKNLYLTDSLLDATKINTLHENIQKLSNLTSEDIADDNERAMINDFFKRFSIYAFMQSGLKSKGAYSLTRFAPLDKFTRIIEGPVKQYVANMNDNVLKSYYSVFVENNGVNNRANSYRFKDYLVNQTFNEIKRGDGLSTSKNPDALIRTTATTNIETYHPIVVDDSDTKLKEMVKENPDKIFIYNSVIPGASIAQRQGVDAIISDADAANITGIPTKKSYAEGKNGEYVIKNTLTDDTYEDNIKLIDAAITQLKLLKDQGKTLVFNARGYGQGMMGINPKRGTTNIAGSAKVGQQTFLYLSKQLLDNFGFVNRNYEATKEGLEEVQKRQPVTDQEVLDFMTKFCNAL